MAKAGGAALLAVVFACPAWAVGGESTPAHVQASRLETVPFSPTPSGWVARGSGYVLGVDRTGMATLRSRTGRSYTSFPLAAIGEGGSLADAQTAVTEHSGRLLATESLGGQVASLLEVRAFRGGIGLRVSIDPAAQGAARSQAVDFLSDGAGGLSLSGELGGWTPQSGIDVPPRDEFMRLPFWNATATRIDGRSWDAFAPPPLDLALHFPAGWLGIGLRQVPNATDMSITSSGGVRINYPLATLGAIPDSGNGGTSSGLVRFPELLVSFGAGPYGVLAGYRRLLAGLDPSLGRRRRVPAWWRRPLVDTFGQQTLDGVDNAHDPSGFTSSYVERFAHRYRRRYGVRHATLVVDATWQQDPGPQRQVGDPQPGPLFGGYAGMRRLIDSLHGLGFKVVLWWQSWLALPGSYADRMGVVHGGCRTSPCPPGSRYGTIDPTSPQFPAYVRAVTRRLLGSGGGDLDADGLKMDFTFYLPSPAGFPWADPSRGIGLAASHRYFATFRRDAHLVKPNALLTAGIAAPQFGDAVDEIRLDDSETVGTSSSEAKWQARARVAATVEPATLIDSDGYLIDAHAALEHFLTAAVYGVPETDYVSAWANGPLGAGEARLIGRIQRLAAKRPPGSALYASPGHWLDVRRGVVVAETLRSAHGGNHLVGVDVWRGKRIRVLATAAAQVALPLHGAAVRNVTAQGRRLAWRSERTVLVVRLERGEEVTVTLGRPAHTCRTAERCARAVSGGA